MSVAPIFGGLGAGGTAGGRTPYVHYRVNITANDGGSYISAAEVAWKRSGANKTRGTANSGTPSASSQQGSFPASEAFQALGGDGTGWATPNGTVTGWLKWADAGTIDVRKVALTALDDFPGIAPKDFTIEHSDDDTTWTVAATVSGQTGWAANETRVFSTGTTTAHKYWRINISASNSTNNVGVLAMRFVLADGSVLTSDARKAVSAAHSQFNSTEAPWRMVDGSTSTGWTSAASTSGWVMMSFAEATEIDELVWTTRSGEGNRAPKDFTIEGSDDASTWTVLKTVTGETGWGSLESRSFMW